MATSKYYKKYASGGNPRNRQISDGLRAMQIQSDQITRSLEKRRSEQKIQDTSLITDLTNKAKSAGATNAASSIHGKALASLAFSV